MRILKDRILDRSKVSAVFVPELLKEILVYRGQCWHKCFPHRNQFEQDGNVQGRRYI